MALSDVLIRTAKATSKPIQLFDGGGLFLQVTPGHSNLRRVLGGAIFHAGAMMKTKKPASNDVIMAVPIGRIESSIVFLRGQKVMIDRDLAGLYGVSTKRLNEQVKRNITRFPSEFMF